MKAIVQKRYGSPDVLELQDVARPDPGENQVRIKVRATTVTKYDCWARSSTAPSGFWLPSRIASGVLKPKQPILGTDVSGDIEALGSEVTRWNVGDPVFGFSERLGAHAEYLCLPEDSVVSKPANLTYEQAAAVVQGGLTALYFLKKGNVGEGQDVLIFGASGGIGSYAVQLAKYFGARVTGVCSTPKTEMVKSLGADHVIDYTGQDFTDDPRTYDIVFDTVGKTSVRRTIRSLNEGGRYILATFGLPTLLQSLWLLRKSSKQAVFGVIEESADDLLFLKGLLEAGELKPVIDRCYSLEQTADAHRYVESGRKMGNVIISM